MYCKALTKQFLEEAGFKDVFQHNGEWIIRRYWYKNNKKEKCWSTIKISEAVRHHKYRPDKTYPKVNFSVRGKGIFSITLNRFLYVWFKGDIPEGYVIDHKNNDPFDNDPKNLNCMTIEDNLNKRFDDNPESWTNQWGKTKSHIVK